MDFFAYRCLTIHRTKLIFSDCIVLTPMADLYIHQTLDCMIIDVSKSELSVSTYCDYSKIRKTYKIEESGMLTLMKGV